MPNDFQPILGNEFQFRIKPMPAFDFDGIIYCKVLELVPFKKLSYSWKGGPEPGRITLDSVVEWTLIPTSTGTDLVLEHRGFTDENLSMYSIMEPGWHKNMLEIAELLNVVK